MVMMMIKNNGNDDDDILIKDVLTFLRMNENSYNAHTICDVEKNLISAGISCLGKLRFLAMSPIVFN